MYQTKITPGVLAAMIGGLSLIICAWLPTNAIVRIKSANQTITVTGSARKPIRSDFILWKGRVALRATNLNTAYTDLKTGMEKAQQYLLAQGVNSSEITVNAIVTKTLYAPAKRNADGQMEDAEATFRPIEGYQLSQELAVRSDKVDKIGEVARKSTELISNGVPFESDAPEYIYTKLSDMKVTMLAAAAKDARNRADQIAINAGCQVGGVRFAHMGALQITPIYSTEVSSGGINDTTSLDKDITAVVTMGFSIR